ncbi:MAG: type IV secretion system DNA-binding domain-containing protein [Alphaproteobacteria bacterium]|nr:type IV secretion system DNA-binding domain-containing protein [Alphaproteobacteria bacterium]
MFAGSDFKNLLFGGTRDRELRDTRRQWESTQAAWCASALATRDPEDFALELALIAAERAQRRPAVPILVEVATAIEAIFRAESIGDIEPRWDRIGNEVAVAVEFRQMLSRRRGWAQGFSERYAAFSRILLESMSAVFDALPESCFGHWDKEASDTFEVILLDLLDDPAAIIDRLFMVPYDDDSFRLDLLWQLRELCATNMLIASGFQPDTNIREVQRKLVRAPDQKGKTGAELAELYLRGSPFRPLLEIPVPFRIPEEVRFEHCHIVGGTGHGKTQLMQKMIHADLLAAREDGRSIIVIDSQGDLINKLVQLDVFSPENLHSLAERLVLIDPADVEYPAALNLFDAHLDRVREYSAADKERVLNGVVELYELFFGAFLGAELTQKQGVVFKYLARLMLAVPEATIHTLMRIMEDGRPFRSYMDQLDGSARYFFETEFFYTSFAATKKQILRRLWGVLSTPAFERMFTQKENKLDLFEAMNGGKIILVSTAKELLKREGSQLLGRFVIAMVSQAALERSTMKEYMRPSCFVYVDEAQEYFDASIETILTQARKYRVGLTLAHQTIDQLSPRLRSAMLANTSIKCVGGVSAKDARTLAEELRTTPEFIEGMKRRGPRSEFAVWVKHHTGQAIRLSVPLGFLEKQPTLNQEEYAALLEQNRRRYCGTLADVEIPTWAKQSEETQRKTPDGTGILRPPSEGDAHNVVGQPEAKRVEGESVREVLRSQERLAALPTSELRVTTDRQLGKGGRQHRYLQSLVKELAEQAGMKATIEAPVPSGAGQVDVLLERDGPVAAVEISVTTPVENERDNLRKCLRGRYPRIAVVLAKSKKAQTSYRAALLEIIPEMERSRVTFLTPEQIPGFVASLAPPPEPTERIVKGYRVKGGFTQMAAPDAEARQEALAKLIASALEP